MYDHSRHIQRVYLGLPLLQTLAASLIRGINTLFLLDAGPRRESVARRSIPVRGAAVEGTSAATRINVLVKNRSTRERALCSMS